MSRTFNRGAAPAARMSRFETIEIGFEHTLGDDDEIVLTLDGDGQPIPRTYKVCTRRTPREVLIKAGQIEIDDLKAAFVEGFDGLAKLLGKLVGDDIVESIITDPTVSPADANAALGWRGDTYGVAEILGLDDGDEAEDDGGGVAPLGAGQGPQPGEPLSEAISPF